MKSIFCAITALFILFRIPVWAGELPAQPLVEFDTAPAPVGVFASVEYPAAAKKEGVQGTVYVEATIAADGSLRAVNVKEGVRGDLDHSALDAVRNTQWRPATKDGKPVEVTVTIPIQFKLEDKKQRK